MHVPKRKSRKHKVTFTFIATEAVTFTCKVDKKQAKPCNTPFKVKFKRYGKHKITVTARDAVGNMDPTPATHSWKLKTSKEEAPPPQSSPPPLINWGYRPPMTSFSAKTRAEAVVLAPQQDIWDVLVDPDLVARFTPFVGRITAEGDHWRWEMGGLEVLGEKVAPAFTERMVFKEPDRIEFHHDPPEGTTEQAGVAGWYDLTPTHDGTELVTELEITLDLPLPRRRDRPCARRCAR